MKAKFLLQSFKINLGGSCFSNFHSDFFDNIFWHLYLCFGFILKAALEPAVVAEWFRACVKFK